jgi:hypothetical protein
MSAKILSLNGNFRPFWGSYGRPFWGYYGLDHTMPTVFNGHMTTEEWNKFCDDIDAFLVPTNRAMNFVRFCSILSTPLVFAMLYFYFQATTATPEAGGDEATRYLNILLVPLAIESFLIGVIAWWGKGLLFKAFCDISAYCEDMSRQYLTLNFHLHCPPRSASMAIEVYVEGSTSSNTSSSNNNNDETYDGKYATAGVGYLPPTV